MINLMKSLTLSKLWYIEANLIYATSSTSLSLLRTSFQILFDVIHFLFDAQSFSNSFNNFSILSISGCLLCRAFKILLCNLLLSYISFSPLFFVTKKLMNSILSNVVNLAQHFSHSLLLLIEVESSAILESITLVS